MVAETTGDRPKMTKVMSSEDEVARLTIEVNTSTRSIFGERYKFDHFTWKF